MTSSRTAAHPKLNEQRETWARKPALRSVYADYYRRIVEACVPGRTVEIGGGSGNLKDWRESTVTTDVVPAPWLDLAADAEALPFRDGAFSNVVGVDVLHHLARPRRFFAEARRVLTPGGRIVLMEPAITPGSYLFYRLFHPEPVRMRVDPLADAAPGERDPFDANQAIPTLLFGRDRGPFERAFPGLRILRVEWLSLFVYPLSGGFRSWCLIPATWTGTLLAAERAAEGGLGPWLGFRLFVTIERS